MVKGLAVPSMENGSRATFQDSIGDKPLKGRSRLEDLLHRRGKTRKVR